MPTLAEQLMASEARLTAACGDSIPRLTDTFLVDARRALELQKPSSSESEDHRYSSGWLTPLAAAFRETGQREFALASLAVYNYWLEREPLQGGAWSPGPDYDVLLIPHRLGDTECPGWFAALPVLLPSSVFSEAFLERLIASARGQLNFLSAHLYPARNIRTSQADALLTQALRFPFLPDSARWRTLGVDALNDCFNRQITSDGSSIEATGWYHYIVMNMAMRFWRLRQAMPELGLQITREQVAPMFDYHCATVEPDGRLTPIGDCWRTRVQPMETLEKALHRRSAVRKELGLPTQPLSTSQFFPDACQAFLRSGWDPDAIYLTFEATRRKGYHWHPARNAIQLSAFGTIMLTDTGALTYDARSPWRWRWALSTRGHNTCNLNGWNQTWTPSAFRYRSVEDWNLFDALYDGGYWPGHDEFAPRPGIFGHHHRTCLWDRSAFIAVLDHLHHRQGKDSRPDLECNWHFGPGKVETDPSARRAVFRQQNTGLLLLFPILPENSAWGLHGGDHPPLQGPDGEALPPIPETWLRLSVPGSESHNNAFAAILIPFRGQVPGVVASNLSDPAKPHCHGLALHWDDGRTDEIWWMRELEAALEKTSSFVTDGALVHLHRVAGGRLKRALVFDGTYLRPHTLADRARPETFSWKDGD